MLHTLGANATNAVRRVGHTIFGTNNDPGRTHSANSLERKRKAVDLTSEARDEAKVTRSAIVISPARPSIAALAEKHNRKFKAGPRDQIIDLYPDPVPHIEVPPMNGAGRSAKRLKTRITDDERRLIGSTELPKDAFIFAAPGTELRTPQSPVRQQHASRPPKPGSDTASFLVGKNTLRDQSQSYKGSAQAPTARGTHRVHIATGRGGPLTTSSSRGSNVKDGEVFDFPDDDKFDERKEPAKRPKTNHPKTNGPMSLAKIAEAIAVRKNMSPAKKEEQERYVPPHQRQKKKAWEPSGPQEFRNVESMIRPSSNKNISWRRQNAKNYQDRRQPMKEAEVVAISDDESPATAPPLLEQTMPARTTESSKPKRKGRYPKEDRNENPDGPQQNGDKSSSLKDYYSVGSDLKRGVLDVLGPKKSVQQQAGLDARNENSSNLPNDSTVDLVQIDGTVSGTADAVESDDEDELSRDTQQPIPDRAKAAKAKSATRHQPSMHDRRARNPKWSIEQAIDPDGRPIEAYDFLVIDILIGQVSKSIRIREADAREASDNLHVIDINRLRGYQTSKHPENVILRLQSAGRGGRERLDDLVFRDHTGMMEFIDSLHQATALKDAKTDKDLTHMQNAYKRRLESSSAKQDEADDGGELALLQSRIGKDITPSKPEQIITHAGRPRQREKLISQMRTEAESSSWSSKEPKSTHTRSHHFGRQSSPVIEQDSAANRTTRPKRTRAHKQKSPTPEVFQRADLGPAWDESLVYPETGRKRVTVDFRDLRRLDPGEFLNDNLIEFYMRWLQEQQPEHPDQKTAYFFGTHFFSTLQDTSTINKGQAQLNKLVNYSAVERWTRAVQIFNYDYVVVPINELSHWYLAIVCNLPSLPRRLTGEEEDQASQDTKEDIKSRKNEFAEMPESAAQAFEGTADKSSSANGRGSTAEAVRSDEARASTPTKAATDSMSEMLLTSPTLTASRVLAGASEENREVVTEEPASADDFATSGTTKDAAESKESKPSQEGVFANAELTSPKKKAGRRKSGPRRFDTKFPTIVIMDPMGLTHSKAIAVLKEYFITEGMQKRGMTLYRDDFQGMHATHEIPRQPNFFDCGIYICGYMHKFMQNPVEFGEKLISQTFEEEDWPQFKSGDMRGRMRAILLGIAKEQREKREADKKAKNELKLRRISPEKASAQKVADSTAPKNDVDHFSPAKSPEPEKRPISSINPMQTSRERLSRSPDKSSKVSAYFVPNVQSNTNNEMLLKTSQSPRQAPERHTHKLKLLDELEAAANGTQEEDSQLQHVSDSEVEESREADSQGSEPAIVIYEDSQAREEARKRAEANTAGRETSNMDVNELGDGEESEFAGFSPDCG